MLHEIYLIRNIVVNIVSHHLVANKHAGNVLGLVACLLFHKLNTKYPLTLKHQSLLANFMLWLFLLAQLSAVLRHLTWRFNRCFWKPHGVVTRKPSGAALSAGCTRFAKKPQWVVKEIIRLKAHMPTASGYVIAATFNQLHDKQYGTTIGKTFAYKVFKQQQYAIYLKRKTIKTKPPVYYAKNQLWQMDITHVQDNNKQVRMILGMVDCGTRANVCLHAMANKTSTSIVRQLLYCVEQYSKPKVIRTDNEACFNSLLFNLSLWLLGIQHQTTQVCSPWQNGRVERFFGTLKRYTKQVDLPAANLQIQLNLFSNWYNQVRPHMNLGYRTPASLWNKQLTNQQGQAYFVSEWDGILTGYYFPP